MRIGIDCRMAGTGEGIARYIEELILHLAKIDKANEYYLIANPEFTISNLPAKAAGRKLANNFTIIETQSQYYSLAEQTTFISELLALKLDLIHFPNFNVPIFYSGKFVITIHDIIHHRYPGKKKSRFFHRLAYRATIRTAVRKAKKIITVSSATKDDIVKTFGTKASKIEVIYEGVDEKFTGRSKKFSSSTVLKKYGITSPYLLFVGVWRQYKNLERLAQAFDILKRVHQSDLRLVLAGKIDPFYPEIREQVFSIGAKSDILALGYVPEAELIELYQHANVFVIPSLVEGFGLIGLEAQEAGVPVAASNIPVMREILGQGALYFNPNDTHDIADKIRTLLTDRNISSRISTAGIENAKKYDWLTTAKQTLKVYEETIRT